MFLLMDSFVKEKKVVTFFVNLPATALLPQPAPIRLNLMTAALNLLTALSLTTALNILIIVLALKLPSCPPAYLPLR